MKQLINLFSSLRLTVILLSLSLLLVFFGTIDQVEFGIWETQKRYFESFFVVWEFPNHSELFKFLYWLKIPLPGGYLLGILLLINLLAAHALRFKLKWKKSGLFLIHFGLIMLLVSELLTDFTAIESQMTIDEGGSKNYSEDFFENELVIIDKSNEDFDKVHSIPSKLLIVNQDTDVPDTSLTIKTIKYFPNSNLFRSKNNLNLNTIANQGLAKTLNLGISEKNISYIDNELNNVSAFIEILDKEKKSLGIWLVSNVFDSKFPPQVFTFDDKDYEISLRFKRYYYDFNLSLIDFKHDNYPGTTVPYNFSSEIYIQDESNNIKQKSLIYMNNPLRYNGLTFYQSSYANENKTSILQVVKNPGWLLPYLSVLLMGSGMIIQFGMHFIKFINKKHI